MPSVQSLELVGKNFTEGIKKKKTNITWKQSFHLSVSPTCPKAYGLDKKKNGTHTKNIAERAERDWTLATRAHAFDGLVIKGPIQEGKVLVISGLSVDSLTVNGQLHAD